jgi:hypothetical protein
VNALLQLKIEKLIIETEEEVEQRSKRSFIRTLSQIAGSIGGAALASGGFDALSATPMTASRIIGSGLGYLAGGYIGDKVAKIAVKDKKPQIGIQTNANLQEYK